MTSFALIKVTTVSVLVGSLGACGFPFLVVLPAPPVAPVPAQPVAEAGPSAADIAAQDRQERRERRLERSESSPADDNVVSRPPRLNVRPSRNTDDEDDDKGRDGGQIAYSPV